MQEVKNDPVNHPSHYTSQKIECIEVTEDLPFCLGNAIKYWWRSDIKGCKNQDLEKSLWYLKRQYLKHKKETEYSLIVSFVHCNVLFIEGEIKDSKDNIKSYVFNGKFIFIDLNFDSFIEFAIFSVLKYNETHNENYLVDAISAIICKQLTEH